MRLALALVLFSVSAIAQPPLPPLPTNSTRIVTRSVPVVKYSLSLGWEINGSAPPDLYSNAVIWRTNGGVFQWTNSVGTNLTATVSNLVQGAAYLFAVEATPVGLGGGPPARSAELKWRPDITNFVTVSLNRTGASWDLATETNPSTRFWKAQLSRSSGAATNAQALGAASLKGPWANTGTALTLTNEPVVNYKVGLKKTNNVPWMQSLEKTQ